ncbi:MAG: tetratricopeptide repeat protein [bacterium]|nr:tetratricopeptide repeat protein [bacterium]
MLNTELYFEFRSIGQEDYSDQIKFYERKIKSLDNDFFDKSLTRNEFIRRIYILHYSGVAYVRTYNYVKAIVIFDFIINAIESNYKKFNIDLNLEHYYLNSLFEKGVSLYNLKNFKESEKVFKRIQESGNANYLHTHWYIYAKNSRFFRNVDYYLILVSVSFLFIPDVIFSFSSSVNLIFGLIGAVLLAISYFKPSKFLANYLYKQLSTKFNESLEERKSTIEYFGDKLKENPKDYFALTERGIAYNLNDQFEESIIDLNLVLSIQTTNTEALYYRANSYINLNKYNEAIIDLTKLIELNDTNIAEKYNSRGNAYLKTKNYELALNDFNEAINLEPFNANYIFSRACFHQIAGNLPESISDYDRVIELDPDDCIALTNRGEVHYALGKKDLAKIDFLKAKEQDYKEAIENLNKLDF